MKEKNNKVPKIKSLFYELTNKENVVFAKDWSTNDTKLVGYMAIFLIIWFAFEDRLLCWANNFFTFNIFSGYQHNAVSFTLVSLIFVYLALTIIPQNSSKNYFIPFRYLLLPLSIVVLYFYYRSKGRFSVSYNYFGVSLLDLVLALIGLYLLISFIFNFFKNEPTLMKNDHNKFYYDDPIELEKDDILGFKESADEFFSRIIATISNNNKSLSIGVIGLWGEGKSSFIKLLINRFKENDKSFIVIEFNPRYSKSITNIQQEFFQILFEELKKYDSRFSSKFLDYLKAINVLESKNILNFLKEGQNFLFDRDDEKDKINKAIERINKKIVVFIDDLDRLIDAEVMEVIKLIHYNAALSNVIFITAYDKNYISQILDKYNHGSGLFTDKFFTIEKTLPFIPRENYSGFIIEQLSDNTNYKTIDLDNSLIIKHCKNNFTSLRDCKRFLNYFIDEYNSKRGSVDFTDFFLLSIIRFKWSEFYEDIRDHKLTKVVSHFDKIFNGTESPESVINSIELAKDYDVNKKIENNLELLLQDLFAKNMNEKSLNNNFVFDNYFMPYVNSYSNPFILESMLLNKISDNTSFIDEIIENKQSGYLIHFLTKKRFSTLNKETFENYFDIILYVRDITMNDYEISETISNLLLLETSKEIVENKIFDDDTSYGNFIVDKFSNLKPEFYINCLSQILLNLNRRKVDENLFAISREVILDIIKDNFKTYIKDNKNLTQEHLNFLHSCILEIDYETNEYGEIILEKESCKIMKDLISMDPDFNFKNLIKPLDPQSNVIGFIPFYNQIFESNEKFEEFINNERFNENDNIILVRNFWILYKNNRFKPVDFTYKGNIEDIINDNFQQEVNRVLGNSQFLDEIIKSKED